MKEGNSKVGKPTWEQKITDDQGVGITNWRHYYSTTLKAIWSAKTYKIIYERIEAAVNNNPATYTIEDNTIVLEDAIKNRIHFPGLVCR